MTCAQARELMNGDTVRGGGCIGQVEMPQRPTGWFKVRWEHGTETCHQIDMPHSVSKIEPLETPPLKRHNGGTVHEGDGCA